MLTQDKFNLTIRTYSKDPCFASRNRLARDKADLQPVFIKRLSFSFLLRELVTVQGDKHGTFGPSSRIKNSWQTHYFQRFNRIASTSLHLLHFTTLHFTTLLFTSSALQLHISALPIYSCTTATDRVNYSRLLASSSWCWKSSSNPDYLPAVGAGR